MMRRINPTGKERIVTVKAKGQQGRFVPVTLSFNIGGAHGVALDPEEECNPGGSAGCAPGTGGCAGGGGFSCVGTSCTGKSGFDDLSFESLILVLPVELERLQTKLREVIGEFVR
jgi:hypothetical protein